MSTTHTALEESNATDLSRAQIAPLEIDAPSLDTSEPLLARATMPSPTLREHGAREHGTSESTTAPQHEDSATRHGASTSVTEERPSFMRRIGDTLKDPHASIREHDSNFTAAHVSGRALLDNATHIVGAPLSFVGNLGAGIANLGRSLTSAIVRNRPEVYSYRDESNSRLFLKKAGANFTESLRDVGDLLNHTQALIPNAVRTLFYGLGAACDGGVNVLSAINA